MADPVEVVAAVVQRDGRYLITRRLEGTHLAGLWELPGGKILPAEEAESALRRELREELGVEASVGELIEAVTWTYPVGGTVHTVTAEDGSFDSFPPAIMPGQTFTFTFTRAGVHTYHCDFHNFMTGEIVVFGSQHDANNDGKSDILCREVGGAASVWLVNGANVLASAGIGRTT